MTKKQFGIIFTLMALIVCVGVLSMKLNESGLTDPTDLGAMLLDGSEEETMSTQDYFYNLRTQKAQSDSKIKEEMKAITEDASASQEAKDIANNSLIQKAQLQEQESRVEMGVMNKGYEDAICMIDSNRVTVYVKVDDAPTIEETASLQQLVEEITGLRDIQIETRK